MIASVFKVVGKKVYQIRELVYSLKRKK